MAQWLNVNTAPAKDLRLVPRPTSGGPQLQVLWPPYSKHLHSRVHAPLIMNTATSLLTYTHTNTHN